MLYDTIIQDGNNHKTQDSCTGVVLCSGHSAEYSQVITLVLTAGHCTSTITNFSIGDTTQTGHPINYPPQAMHPPSSAQILNYNLPPAVEDSFVMVPYMGHVSLSTPFALATSVPGAGTYSIEGYGVATSGGQIINDGDMPYYQYGGTVQYSSLLDQNTETKVVPGSSNQLACNGDSGGPLFSGNTLYGILAWWETNQPDAGVTCLNATSNQYMNLGAIDPVSGSGLTYAQEIARDADAIVSGCL
jgi:hypothetical protein